MKLLFAPHQSNLPTHHKTRVTSGMEKLRLAVHHLFDLKKHYIELQMISKRTNLLCKSALHTALKQIAMKDDEDEVKRSLSLNEDKKNINLNSNSNTNLNANVNANSKTIPNTTSKPNEKETKSNKFLKKKKLSSKNDSESFSNDLDLSPIVSYNHLKESSFFLVFQELLMATTVYLESGGPLQVRVRV
jgi:hypothetical protein